MKTTLWDIALRRLGTVVALVSILGTTQGCVVGVAEEDADTDAILGEAVQPIYWNGHDYLFFLASATWQQARTNCIANGYYLVSINSSSEETWLQNQETQRGGGYWWIGYSDIGYEGTWIWEDQSNSVYKNWYVGEPNNSGDEDCAMDNLPGGKWNDANCGDAFKFICERNY